MVGRVQYSCALFAMQSLPNVAMTGAPAVSIDNVCKAFAAEILGVDQPKASALVIGRLPGFSFERLTHFPTLLGRDVAITVSRM